MTIPSAKLRNLPARVPVALTDLLYLVDPLGTDANYKATVAKLFAALGIFYVPVGAPDITLGEVGNYAFRGDGTVGSYLYHKTQTGGLSIRRQQQLILTRTERSIIRWDVVAGSGGALISSWDPIL